MKDNQITLVNIKTLSNLSRDHTLLYSQVPNKTGGTNRQGVGKNPQI